MEQPIHYPLKTTIYWGEGAVSADAQTRTFQTEGEYAGYIRGIMAADGWGGFEFVPHSHFQVDERGFVVEIDHVKIEPDPKVVHVMWGEAPEPDSTPDTWVLDSPEQAEAFRDGINDMITCGTSYLFVPDDKFVPYRDLEDAAKSIGGDGARAIKRWMKAQGAGNDDMVFARSDGAFVDDKWVPGEAVFNQPADAVPGNRLARTGIKMPGRKP